MTVHAESVDSVGLVDNIKPIAPECVAMFFILRVIKLKN